MKLVVSSLPKNCAECIFSTKSDPGFNGPCRVLNSAVELTEKRPTECPLTDVASEAKWK